MQTTPFQDLVRIAGSQAELRRLINAHLPAEEQITAQAVSKWEGGIPANRCILLEQISGGAVTRYQMRPDIFGEAPAQQAA